GINAQAGTSTGRVQRETCHASLDAPNVRGREGAEYLAGCRTLTPFLTTFKGSVTYTVPKVDVLLSTVFQSLPGVEQTASMTYSKDQISWNPESAATPANENTWLQPTGLVSPRFVRVQVQLDF